MCRNGLLLIDELETAIHTKALRKTFEWLVDACVQNNVQLFATTHSLETIDAIIDASKSDVVDLVAYRLEQGKTKTEANRFDKGLLTHLREDLGLEVRQCRAHVVFLQGPRGRQAPSLHRREAKGELWRPALRGWWRRGVGRLELASSFPSMESRSLPPA
jgi:hypothetical protein